MVCAKRQRNMECWEDEKLMSQGSLWEINYTNSSHKHVLHNLVTNTMKWTSLCISNIQPQVSVKQTGGLCLVRNPQWEMHLPITWRPLDILIPWRYLRLMPIFRGEISIVVFVKGLPMDSQEEQLFWAEGFIKANTGSEEIKYIWSYHTPPLIIASRGGIGTYHVMRIASVLSLLPNSWIRINTAGMQGRT